MSGNDRAEAPEHVHQIDALRGLAACAVAFVFHSGAMFGAWPQGPLDDLPVFSWIHRNGYAAVDLFFVISGYVFAHVYLTGRGLRDGVSFRGFMLARFARLYPLHLVTLLVSAAIAWAGFVRGVGVSSNDDAWHFLLNVLFLQESGLNQGYSFNVPAWSLSVEMLCYVLFIMAAMSGPHMLRRAALILILCGVILSMGSDKSLMNIGRGLAGYFTGYMLWLHRDRLERLPLLPIGAAAAAILALGIKPPGIHYGTFLSLTVWPVLLLAGRRSSLLAAAPLRWLGERSYSIYLLHAPVYAFIFILIFDRQPAPPSLWAGTTLAATAAILLLAHLSFRYFEVPARLYIRALPRRRRLVAAADTAA